MKYISFVWWIAKYCDFFLFVICVCLHPYINTPAVNCEERSKLSTGGYQLTGRVHGLSERSINYLPPGAKGRGREIIKHIACLMSNRVILLKRPYISPNIAPRGLECEKKL